MGRYIEITMPPTMPPTTTIIKRLYDRGQGLYRGVDLGLVELGYLGQHPVYVTRLLPDGDHARHHRREDGLCLQRLVDRDALADGVPALQEGLLHNPVTRGRCGYLYGLQYRHPGRAQGGEGAREAGEGGLLHDVSDLGRYPEHGPAPHLPATLGLLPSQEHDHGERHPGVHEHPEYAGQDVGDKHANPGWQRERPPRSWNILANTGTIKMSMKEAARIARTRTTIG